MRKREEERKERVRIEIDISANLHRRLNDFCAQQSIDPSRVVERALEEYFHMGDVAH